MFAEHIPALTVVLAVPPFGEPEHWGAGAKVYVSPLLNALAGDVDVNLHLLSLAVPAKEAFHVSLPVLTRRLL